MRTKMPEGFEAEIGAIAVNAAGLESDLLMYIGILLNPDQRVGQTVAAQLQFRQRVEMLRALYGLLPSPGLEDEFEALLGQMQAAGDERNRVMHADWFLAVGSDCLKRFQRKRRSAEVVDAVTVTLEDLRKVRTQICAARGALSKFIDRQHIPPTAARDWSPDNPVPHWCHTLYEHASSGPADHHVEGRR
jgi:hypothetical protein